MTPPDNHEVPSDTQKFMAQLILASVVARKSEMSDKDFADNIEKLAQNGCEIPPSVQQQVQEIRARLAGISQTKSA